MERWPNCLPSVEEHCRTDRWSDLRHAAFLALCLSPQVKPLLIIDAEPERSPYGRSLVHKALAESRSAVTIKYDRNLSCIIIIMAYREYEIAFAVADQNEITRLLPVGKAETILVNHGTSHDRFNTSPCVTENSPKERCIPPC